MVYFKLVTKGVCTESILIQIIFNDSFLARGRVLNFNTEQHQQVVTIQQQISIGSTPDTSMLYQYKTSDHNKYIFGELILYIKTCTN